MTHPRITLESLTKLQHGARVSRKKSWVAAKLHNRDSRSGIPCETKLMSWQWGVLGVGHSETRNFDQQKIYRISQQNCWFYGRKIWTWQSEWIPMFWINSTNVKSWKHRIGFTIGYRIYDFASGRRNAEFLWRIQLWGKMREHETPSSESHSIIKIEMPTVSEIMNENTKYIYIYACTIYIYICMYNIYICIIYYYIIYLYIIHILQFMQ